MQTSAVIQPSMINWLYKINIINNLFRLCFSSNHNHSSDSDNIHSNNHNILSSFSKNINLHSTSTLLQP
ncbi:hypothetical protein BVRB_5g117440 [Beta vulgaris subsp. vulgaris]|nr:hypothetical protein BVRB_5g117440 [Beta vulgaris subsp. vulgaris]